MDVLVDERRDHPLAEGLDQVADPVRRAGAHSQLPRLVDGLERTARLFGRGLVRFGVAEVAEGDALDAAAEFLQHGQRDRAVDAAAQTEQNPCAGGQGPAQGFRKGQREGHWVRTGSGAFIRSRTILMFSAERPPMSPSGSYLTASSHSSSASR